MSLVIRARGLAYRYREAETPVQIGDLELLAGESCLLAGPSGIGKSTFLNLVAGVLEGYEGDLEVLGSNWKHTPASTRDRLRAERMGYVFQSFNLLPYLSALENVLLPSRLAPARRKGRSVAQANEHARALLGRVGLADRLTARVSALSIGQQQRVAAVRALIDAPELLLADEPTSSLDPRNKRSFMELLLPLCQEAGTALLMVSHDETMPPLFNKVLHLGKDA
jgi:putative ABC transport system ATP-binding protein